MLLIVEKVIALKSVSIFADTPEEYLAEIAAITEEVRAAPGEEIIRRGDIGTSMYLVYQGKVRVHHEDRELAVLGERTVFGEFAALDPEPRTASVTAIDDTHLFRLEGDAIYDLMAENVEVGKGIIHALVRRMRELAQPASDK